MDKHNDYKYLLKDITIYIPRGLVGAVALQYLSQLLTMASLRDPNSINFDDTGLTPTGIKNIHSIILDQVMFAHNDIDALRFPLQYILTKQGIPVSKLNLDDIPASIILTLVTAYYTKIALEDDTLGLLSATQVKSLIGNMDVVHGDLSVILNTMKGDTKYGKDNR